MAARDKEKKHKNSSVSSFPTSKRNAGGLGKNLHKSREMSPSVDESMKSGLGSKRGGMSRVGTANLQKDIDSITKLANKQENQPRRNTMNPKAHNKPIGDPNDRNSLTAKKKQSAGPFNRA